MKLQLDSLDLTKLEALLGEMRFGEPTFDESRMMIVMTMQNTQPEGAGVRGVSVSLLGREGAGQISIYVPEKEYEIYANAVAQVVASASMDPGYGFRPSTARPTGRTGTTNRKSRTRTTNRKRETSIFDGPWTAPLIGLAIMLIIIGTAIWDKIWDKVRERKQG